MSDLENQVENTEEVVAEVKQPHDGAEQGDKSAVKGRRIAANVNILTPGIAPKSIPPNTPKIKIPIVKGSPKSVAVPAKKFSIMTNHQNI